jgi:hypothetical protein
MSAPQYAKYIGGSGGGGGGGGNVSGPGSSTLDAIARWGNTSGTSLLNSDVTVDGSGNIVSPGSLTLGSLSTVISSNIVNLQGIFPNNLAQFSNVAGEYISVYTGAQVNTNVNEFGLSVFLTDNNGTPNTTGGYFSAGFDTTTYSNANDLNFGLGNFGAESISQGGPNSGLNVGHLGYANGGLISVGLFGQTGSGTGYASTTSVGVVGYGGSTGSGANNIGGHFYLYPNDGTGANAYSPPAISAGLLVENDTAGTLPVALFYAAGSEVIEIDPSGNFIVNGTQLQVINGGGAAIDGGASITNGGLNTDGGVATTKTGVAISFGNSPTTTGSVGGKVGLGYYNPENIFNWGFYSLLQIATPTFPAHDANGNATLLYAKSDGNLYYFPEGGSETLIGSGGGSGANTALSNLASTAINTDLLFGSDNTNNIGSSGHRPSIILIGNYIGSSGNNFVQFNDSSNLVKFGQNGQVSWGLASPYSGNYDLQALQNGGDYANLVWVTEGTGDIGATNNGAVMQRPRNIYVLNNVHVGGSVIESTQTATATNAGSVTSTGAPSLFLSVSGTIATYTVNAPSSPFDGQRLEITTNGTITSLTFNATSVYNPTASLAMTGAKWTYSVSIGAWMRNY